jgi:hypothetical protein
VSEKGRPLSLAKDQSWREAAAMFVMAQKILRQMRMAVSTEAAALEEVAL